MFDATVVPHPRLPDDLPLVGAWSGGGGFLLLFAKTVKGIAVDTKVPKDAIINSVVTPSVFVEVYKKLKIYSLLKKV